MRLAEETGNPFTRAVALEGLALTHLVAGHPLEAAAACQRAHSLIHETGTALNMEASILAHLAWPLLLAAIQTPPMTLF